jgi:hypothetical protein
LKYDTHINDPLVSRTSLVGLALAWTGFFFSLFSCV